MFETENLLVGEDTKDFQRGDHKHVKSPVKNKKPSSKALDNSMEREQAYREYCSKIVHYTTAENFYIFTSCNLVQSNDQRKFYR